MNSKKFIILALMIFSIIGFSFVRRGDRSSKLILIDPGHGGKDPGSISLTGSYEKDINLIFAKSLKKALIWKGYRVEMTREDDDFLELSERTSLANSMRPDLFLSIHCNAMENNPEIEGIQVFYFPSGENAVKAQIILENILDLSAAENRGAIESKDLIVLKETTSQAFLIELGFLTNPKESKLLEDRSYRKLLLKGITNSVDSLLVRD